MKSLLLLLIGLLLGFFVQAQNEGKIIYQQTVKIKIDGLPDDMKDMMPTSQSSQKELWFAGKTSLYQDVKGEEAGDLELSSDDGSFQIVLMTDETEDIFYKDFSSSSTVHQKGIMGKSFVVSDELKKWPWKITSEKIKYLGYECQKAVIENDDEFIVAWFTSEIPAQIGPGRYHGLPGAILMVSVDDGDREVKALSVDLVALPEDVIKKPKKGQKVTEEEYKKIEAAKIKEMEEMHGSHREIRN